MTTTEARAIVWDLIARRVQYYRRDGAKFDVIVRNVVSSIVDEQDPAADDVRRFTRAMLVGIELDELDTPEGYQRYRAAVRFARDTSGVELRVVPKDDTASAGT